MKYYQFLSFVLTVSLSPSFANAINDDVRDTLRVISGDYELRIQKSNAQPSLTVEFPTPDRVKLDRVKSKLRSTKVERSFAEICVLAEDEKGNENLLAVWRLDKHMYNQYKAMMPFMKKARFKLGINLKSAGITDSFHFLILDENDLKSTDSKNKRGNKNSLIREILTMAGSGKLSFTAKLSQIPLSKRKATATLQTDKGELGIEVLLDKNMGYTDSDFLVLTTAGQNEIRIPLGRLPGAAEAVAKLTTRTGMLREHKVRLSLNDEGFVVEYPQTRGSVDGLRTTKGVVAVNKEGRAIAPPQVVSWTPTFAIRRVVNPECDYEMSYMNSGTSQRLTSFVPYFKGDGVQADRVIEFDPGEQQVVLTYDKNAEVKSTSSP